MPRDWAQRWPEFYAHLTTFRRLFKANRHDDAADVLTGIVERESGFERPAKICRFGFLS